MQIQQATKEELGLLITALRSIEVMDQVETKQRLLIQLETELATRYSLRIGGPQDQSTQYNTLTIKGNKAKDTN